MTSSSKRGGVALTFGLLMLIGGIAWASSALSKDSDRGGDVGAYEAENNHYRAVYGGGFFAVVGGVLVLVGLVRRAGPSPQR